MSDFRPCCEVAIESALEDVDALDHAAETAARFECAICDRDLTRYVLASSCRRMLDRTVERVEDLASLRRPRSPVPRRVEDAADLPEYAPPCGACGWPGGPGHLCYR